MAFTQQEREAVERAMDGFLERRRPPPDVRAKLDIGYRVDGQSVAIFELRPAFDRPGETVETPVAKATFVRTRDLWKVFWMRSDLKWHSYEPVPTVGSIDKFLQVVEADRHACFFG